VDGCRVVPPGMAAIAHAPWVDNGLQTAGPTPVGAGVALAVLAAGAGAGAGARDNSLMAQRPDAVSAVIFFESDRLRVITDRLDHAAGGDGRVECACAAAPWGQMPRDALARDSIRPHGSTPVCSRA
jgi:hypothetical protein